MTCLLSPGALPYAPFACPPMEGIGRSTLRLSLISAIFTVALAFKPAPGFFSGRVAHTLCSKSSWVAYPLPVLQRVGSSAAHFACMLPAPQAVRSTIILDPIPTWDTLPGGWPSDWFPNAFGCRTLVVFKGADFELSTLRIAGWPYSLPRPQLFLTPFPPGVLLPHVTHNQESSPSRLLVRARPSELRRHAPPPSLRRQLRTLPVYFLPPHGPRVTEIGIPPHRSLVYPEHRRVGGPDGSSRPQLISEKK
jgi:hypothetical protein